MRKDLPSQSIAILGIGLNFPGASHVDAFWDNLLAGQNQVSRFSPEELRAAGVSPAQTASEHYIPAKAILDKPCAFDPDFFRMTDREAELTDPAHRQFLIAVWKAFENAAILPSNEDTSVGVFGGVSESTYLLNHLFSDPALLREFGKTQLKVAGDKDFFTTRVSYKFNFRGPSVAVQTSCSTGLVAVHMACQSLLNGEIDVAVAGAASINFPLVAGYEYRSNSIYSKDGLCRPFDAEASGTVFGDGVAAVILKPYDAALADGDPIWALIDGSAINNDGAAKAGFAAPSVEGQAAVIQEALAVAGVDPADVDFVETHGTATALGDAVEVKALSEVFAARRDAAVPPLVLGSVKGQIGHLNTCAGLAGLIKACLALRHGMFPGTVNFRAPNPLISMDPALFRVSASSHRLAGASPVQRHVGSVSSFGVGGTNAHVVLSAAPAPAKRPEERAGPWVLPVSARSDEALERMIIALRERIERTPGRKDDMAFTLQTGRELFNRRAVLILEGTHLQRVPADGTATVEEHTLVDLDVLDRRLLNAAFDWMGLAVGELDVPRDRLDKALASAHASFSSADIRLPKASLTDSADRVGSQLLGLLARHWCRGATLDWQQLLPSASARRIALPGYAFGERELLAGNGTGLLDHFEVRSSRSPSTEPSGDSRGTAGDSLPDMLVQQFGRITGRATFGATDEFFEAGGDSMMAIDLVTALEEVLGTQVPYELLLRHSTPAALAEALAIGLPVSGNGSHVEQEAPGATLPFELLDQQPIPCLRSTAARSSIGEGAADEWVVLTGVTGFLGGRLLEMLLKETSLGIACLIRPRHGESAQERLLSVMRDLKLDAGKMAPRVRAVAADLRSADLGLGESDAAFILSHGATYIHAGSEVNWAFDYERLRLSNSMSTRHLLALAAKGRGRRFVYISSVAVFDGPHWGASWQFSEQQALRGVEHLYTGYARSKGVSELMVSDARVEGMETCVVRPAYIIGDSRDGRYNSKDFVYNVLSAIHRVGAAPASEYRLSVTPVDQVAQGIVRLATAAQALSGAYHVMSPESSYLGPIVEALRRQGAQIDRVSDSEFHHRLQAAAASREIDAIYPFVDHFRPSDHDVSWCSSDGVRAIGKTYDTRRALSIVPPDIYRLDDDIQARCLAEFLHRG